MRNRTNPINSVYLIALASTCVISYVYSFYTALIFSLVTAFAFLISISIVSMIEKLSEKTVRFIVFTLISAALITVFKFVSTYFTLDLIVNTGKVIDFALLPCLMMAIIPIYFEDTLSTKQFFGNSLLYIGIFVLMMLLMGATVEVLGNASILGFKINMQPIEFFIMPYGKMIIIATLAILFNIVRRAYLKKTREFRTLVEKYKHQIYKINEVAKKTENAQQEGGDK